MEKRYFEYGDEEIAYLKAKDKRLAEVIEKLGHLDREVHADLFPALVDSIVAQQISGKAAATVMGRIIEGLGEITPERIAAVSIDELQQFGMSFSKARYIHNAGERVAGGELDLEALRELPDDEVCRELCAFDGIGVWTAEMLMIFSLQRKDVLSFGDFGIHKGMRMVHHHRRTPRDLFEKYRRRYAPYNSIASLYFWEVANGTVEGMKDYAPKKKPKKNAKSGEKKAPQPDKQTDEA